MHSAGLRGGAFALHHWVEHIDARATEPGPTSHEEPPTQGNPATPRCGAQDDDVN